MDEMLLMGFGTYMGEDIQRSDLNRVTQDAVLCALKAGYRHLDLAENYHNLDGVAAALALAFTPSPLGLGLSRSDVWLTMKIAYDLNPVHVDALLKKLHVDYFDLGLIHFPKADRMYEDEARLCEVWSTFSSCTGLRRVGVSNFYEAHLTRLLALCEREGLTKPFANQIEVNLGFKNLSCVDYCQAQGIDVMAYSPLGYNFSSYLLSEQPKLRALADKVGATPAQAALAWSMAKGCFVIPKSTRIECIEENYRALGFVDAVKGELELTAAIDSSEDLCGSGVTLTTEDMRHHGEALRWDVSESLSLGRI